MKNSFLFFIITFCFSLYASNKLFETAEEIIKKTEETLKQISNQDELEQLIILKTRIHAPITNTISWGRLPSIEEKVALVKFLEKINRQISVLEQQIISKSKAALNGNSNIERNITENPLGSLERMTQIVSNNRMVRASVEENKYLSLIAKEDFLNAYNQNNSNLESLAIKILKELLKSHINPQGRINGTFLNIANPTFEEVTQRLVKFLSIGYKAHQLLTDHFAPTTRLVGLTRAESQKLLEVFYAKIKKIITPPQNFNQLISSLNTLLQSINNGRTFRGMHSDHKLIASNLIYNSISAAEQRQLKNLFNEFTGIHFPDKNQADYENQSIKLLHDKINELKKEIAFIRENMSPMHMDFALKNRKLSRRYGLLSDHALREFVSMLSDQLLEYEQHYSISKYTVRFREWGEVKSEIDHILKLRGELYSIDHSQNPRNYKLDYEISKSLKAFSFGRVDGIRLNLDRYEGNPLIEFAFLFPPYDTTFVSNRSDSIKFINQLKQIRLANPQADHFFSTFFFLKVMNTSLTNLNNGESGKVDLELLTAGISLWENILNQREIRFTNFLLNLNEVNPFYFELIKKNVNSIVQKILKKYPEIENQADFDVFAEKFFELFSNPIFAGEFISKSSIEAFSRLVKTKNNVDCGHTVLAILNGIRL